MTTNKLFTLSSILIQLTILTFFSFYLFPKYHEPIKAGASKQYQTMDVKIGYDKTFVINLFDTIGEKGKRQYERVEKELDMIFPVLYTLFFYSLIKYLSMATSSNITNHSTLFVLIGGFADLGENIIILYCLNTPHQNISTTFVSFGSTLTITKYAVIVLSLIISITLLTKLFVQRTKNLTSK